MQSSGSNNNNNNNNNNSSSRIGAEAGLQRETRRAWISTSRLEGFL